jgi:hypothetical protein
MRKIARSVHESAREVARDIANTELGIFVRCPELARDVTRAIDMSRLHSSYLVRFGPDGQSLEWQLMGEQREEVFTSEPDALRSWSSATCCSRRLCRNNSFRPRFGTILELMKLRFGYRPPIRHGKIQCSIFQLMDNYLL